ncbi:hypothetical protein [Variovorax ginsengisoli]|uniref:Uncharacterized protein n=1 Tax=Variovorax ginsengisoli TaxID=363844 RepID=A0ABT9S8P1_9BURK|nr:hypothetical protein [Variovorax ginsengisoli]MDP9900720.1 hypothetical protein [Variovorax ginsengisoli]
MKRSLKPVESKSLATQIIDAYVVTIQEIRLMVQAIAASRPLCMVLSALLGAQGLRHFL